MSRSTDMVLTIIIPKSEWLSLGYYYLVIYEVRSTDMVN